MNKELVWLLLPIVGLLSQLGGTYNKLYRRVCVPLVITGFSSLLLGFTWWLPVLFISVFGVSTLPFTFKGSSLYDHWFNWIWIWIAGFLLGIPSILIGGSIFSCFIPCVVQGIVGTCSNLKFTAKYFQWKFCEFIIWASMAYCYALPLSLR